MLFKFYFKRTRTVSKSMNVGGETGIYKWEEEQAAYSKDAYFRDLQPAVEYAQSHVKEALSWESDHGIMVAKHSDMEFIIVEDSAAFEPSEPMPIPTEFYDTSRDPD